MPQGLTALKKILEFFYKQINLNVWVVPASEKMQKEPTPEVCDATKV